MEFISSQLLQRSFLSPLLVLNGLLFYMVSSFSSELYFLCGPDEDGCFEGEYKYCACIPHDATPNTPHCLDFNTITCKPLSEASNCRPDRVFKNQGDCIATMFHSTPTTPCRVKTRDFCIQQHIIFCDHNAEPSNCHKSPD